MVEVVAIPPGDPVGALCAFEGISAAELAVAPFAPAQVVAAQAADVV